MRTLSLALVTTALLSVVGCSANTEETSSDVNENDPVEMAESAYGSSSSSSSGATSTSAARASILASCTDRNDSSKTAIIAVDGNFRIGIRVGTTKVINFLTSGAAGAKSINVGMVAGSALASLQSISVSAQIDGSWKSDAVTCSTTGAFYNDALAQKVAAASQASQNAPAKKFMVGCESSMLGTGDWFTARPSLSGKGFIIDGVVAGCGPFTFVAASAKQNGSSTTFTGLGNTWFADFSNGSFEKLTVGASSTDAGEKSLSIPGETLGQNSCQSIDTSVLTSFIR